MASSLSFPHNLSLAFSALVKASVTLSIASLISLYLSETSDFLVGLRFSTVEGAELLPPPPPLPPPLTAEELGA
jgi:hypothetical protein